MNQKIINWTNVLANSETFKNNKPYSFGFVENVFEPDFYNMLYETYPKVGSSWYRPTHFDRSATKRGFGMPFGNVWSTSWCIRMKSIGTLFFFNTSAMASKVGPAAPFPEFTIIL